jgi:blocked early in transport 1
MAYNRAGGGTGAWKGPPSVEQRVEEGNRTMLEQENDAKWAELGDQVALLKGLSMEINAEVDSQNSLLDGMGDSFSGVTSMFTSTIGKMGDMLSKGSSWHMYYLIIFVVFVFFVIYFMIDSR